MYGKYQRKLASLNGHFGILLGIHCAALYGITRFFASNIHMKLLILFFLICTFSTFGQLDGTYSHNYGLGHEAFEFHTDGTFSYFFSHCTGRNVGSGQYTKRGRSLILRFETDSTVVTEPVVKIEKMAMDSAIIKVNVTEFSYGKYGALLTATDTNGIPVQQYQSDVDGNVTIDISSISLPFDLTTTYREKNISLLHVVSYSAYSVRILLPNCWEQHYKTGDVDRYTIKKAGKGAFYLKAAYPDANFVLFSIEGAGPP
jgi:hypothetical protein